MQFKFLENDSKVAEKRSTFRKMVQKVVEDNRTKD